MGGGCVDQSTIALSRNGVPDIARGAHLRSLGFTLGWLTEAEYETGMGPLSESVGKVDPLYLCFDPDPTTYRQRRTYFGRLAETKVKRRSVTRFEKQLDMVSMI